VHAVKTIWEQHPLATDADKAARSYEQKVINLLKADL
jgi:hypothetical protein